MGSDEIFPSKREETELSIVGAALDSAHHCSLPNDMNEVTIRRVPWAEGLTAEQREAAGHVGNDARLLAGPGTGKTLALTRRIAYLIDDRREDPDSVLALTFTRAAARELRDRVESHLPADLGRPRITTLHSFALRQLLRNSGAVPALPHPLRIADDWEERHIVLEDLKSMLNLTRIDDARDLLNQLSADWQELTADEEGWDDRFPNPAFLGAWNEHRTIYGYVLRSELVYQLKRALEQVGDLDLEGPPRHVLVDEYQDLNRCDLAVVKALDDRGAEIYGAGDDDQSIYGFRKAHPLGIRRFPDDYPGSADLSLDVCKRCDRNILALALFVAEQDYARIPKPIRSDEGRDEGEVAILRFGDQTDEALGIARVCRHLIESDEVLPEKILILLRTDRNRAFSSEIRTALEVSNVPVTSRTTSEGPLDENDGRLVLALLRLCANGNDHLAWRTALQIRANQIGPVAIRAIYELARRLGATFSEALEGVVEDATLLPAPHGTRVQTEVGDLRAALAECDVENLDTREIFRVIVHRVVETEERAELLLAELELALDDGMSLEDYLRNREAADEGIQQDLETGRVNILTMHQAKGLTADAVIVAAAEDEYIPGRAEGDAIGDERRLLYVSLTRARHALFVTYCERRIGTQRYTGRTSGASSRHLTRFLRDAPVAPLGGAVFLDEL